MDLSGSGCAKPPSMPLRRRIHFHDQHSLLTDLVCRARGKGYNTGTTFGEAILTSANTDLTPSRPFVDSAAWDDQEA